jgi:uncharacterized protein YeaO (DUF488 family)
MITLTRVYDYHPKASSKTWREPTILVDRLWPRGISKDKLEIDLWLKDIAPSDKLRKWFSHDPKKWQQFEAKYMQEITKSSKKMQLLQQIRETEKEKGSVILLYSAKDKEHNNAVALKEILYKSEI